MNKLLTCLFLICSLSILGCAGQPNFTTPRGVEVFFNGHEDRVNRKALKEIDKTLLKVRACLVKRKHRVTKQEKHLKNLDIQLRYNGTESGFDYFTRGSVKMSGQYEPPWLIYLTPDLRMLQHGAIHLWTNGRYYYDKTFKDCDRLWYGSISY